MVPRLSVYEGWKGREISAASDLTCLFVTHMEMKRDFFGDTGAILHTNAHQGYKNFSYELTAANGYAIRTCGIAELCVDLRLRCYCLWHFIVADIIRTIIGADFFGHYGLLVDLKSSQLIDVATNCTFCRRVFMCDVLSEIVNILDESAYYQRLVEFSVITCLNKSVLLHHIEKAPGLSVASKTLTSRTESIFPIAILYDI